MRFVIDETSWKFEHLGVENCVDALETMLDLLDDAFAEGHPVCYSDELFNTFVWRDKTFYDLYSDDSPIAIPRDVQERIGTIFNGLAKWQDLPQNWPPSFDVKVGGQGICTAPSVAWAHEQTLSDNECAVACIVLYIEISGMLDTEVSTRSIPLWFVKDRENYCLFFRWLITETTTAPSGMESFALSAFPKLDFISGAFGGIKDMSKPYQTVVRSITHHLGVLSDHGQRVFSGPRSSVASEFGGLHVDISDENGNTKGNSVARTERTKTVNGSNVVFWWHTKLERHQNRIHIYPDNVPTGGRILIGIFCLHLTT